jgi:hypothetical protein
VCRSDVSGPAAAESSEGTAANTLTGAPGAPDANQMAGGPTIAITPSSSTILRTVEVR